MARIAITQVSKEWFEVFLRGEFALRPNMVLESNAPQDLEVMGLAYPKEFQGYPYTFYVYVKSKSFEDIPEGAEPPLLNPFRYSIREMTPEEISKLSHA